MNPNVASTSLRKIRGEADIRHVPCPEDEAQCHRGGRGLQQEHDNPPHLQDKGKTFQTGQRIVRPQSRTWSRRTRRRAAQKVQAETALTRRRSRTALGVSVRLSVSQRPYRVECTGSLPNSEVKRRRARIVPGWGTAWEVLRVLLAFCFGFYSFLGLSICHFLSFQISIICHGHFRMSIYQ